MAAYVPFNVFPGDFLAAKHNFNTDEFRIMLTNSEPEADLYKTVADIVEIAAGNGYTAGGVTTVVSLGPAGAEWAVTGTSIIIQASGGAIGPFGWAVLYNYSHIDQPLIAYWAYDGGQTILLDTEQITLAFPGTGIFRVAQA